MGLTYRKQFRLRIIGYVNIFFIFLGLTRVRIDFIGQRVVHSRFVAFYVICANIATLVFVSLFYIYNVIRASSTLAADLETFSGTVDVLISFVAVAFSVFLRGRRERINLEIANSIISFDRNYFIEIYSYSNNSAVDCLLYFKLLTLSLPTFVPLYSSVTSFYDLDVHEVVHTFCTAYLQSILAASLFMYFYLLWLLRKRFWLLNMKLKESLRQLQSFATKAEHQRVETLMKRRLVAAATENVMKISQIHARLSRLLVRLNAGYKQQIVAVLLAYLIDSISFGYFLTLAIDVSLEWEFDFETILLCSYAVILFVDINAIYWMSDLTIDSHVHMAQVLRRFLILPPLGDDFEQQCELLALQLLPRNRSLEVTKIYGLNRQGALALWAFVLVHIVILVQFDLESRLITSTDNLLLEQFNQLFRIEVDYV